MAEIERLGEGSVSRPLLVIDGDSLTHRAYHALPKSMRRAEGKPATRCVGFSNFLMRLWQAEEPRAVLVGWDTLVRADVPPRAVRGLPGRTRVRRRAARAARPHAGARARVRLRSREGRRATRPTTSSPPAVKHEEERGGTAVVVTSDRDSFQLASDADDDPAADARRQRACARRPGRGARALRRRARTGAGLHRAARRPLRQDAGRAAASARRRPASLLAQYGTLEAMLEDGRFEAQAEELRMYRRMATLDASAPLPPLDDQTPNWAEASSFVRELGHERSRPTGSPRGRMGLADRRPDASGARAPASDGPSAEIAERARRLLRSVP